MEKQLTISQIPSNQETDYQLLYRQGIELLQKYSGDIWTDYNEHDPGVTILESLCYVLTELFDRSETQVNEMLTKKDGGSYTSENGFYTAAEILHNAPLTLNDYRKFIIDSVDKTNNAWVEPYYYKNEKLDDNVGIVGLYEVFLDLDTHETDNEKNIQEEVVQLLNNNRVFTELFSPSKITILKQIDLIISFNLYLDEKPEIEDTIAEIFFSIANFVRPGIRHYSYQNMLDLGFSTDEIFEGPRLKNGFINNADLTQKPSVLYFDNLTKLINKVSGVRSVNNLELYTRNDQNHDYTRSNEQTPLLRISKDSFAKLGVFDSLFNTRNNDSQIKVFVNNAAYNFNKNLVVSKYNELLSKKKKTDKFNYPASKLNIEIPKTNYVELANYFSLQNDFPLIYGIGENKLPQNISENRKVQALQLKTYLLFFEQMLSDFNKQVASVGHLFSMESQHQTFFYQDLYPVPDVVPLLKGFKGSAAEIYDSKLGNQYYKNTTEFKADKNNDYISGLKEIYAKKDEFSTRRNAFLNHLLSRFGFSFKDIITSSYEKETDEMIRIKENILKKIPDITSLRGHAIPDDHNSDNNKVLSFVRMLHLLSNIKYNQLNDKQTELYKWLIPVIKPEDYNLFSLADRNKLNINVKSDQFTSVVFSGLFLENYEISETEESISINLNSSGKMYKLFESPDKEELYFNELKTEFISDFFKIYSQLENVYILDHILLLPSLDEEKFIWKNAPVNSQKNSAGPISYDALFNTLDLEFERNDQVLPLPEIGILNDKQIVNQDFYSSRITIYLPGKSNNQDMSVNSNYLHALFIGNLPAHIYVELFWIDETEQHELSTIFQNFKLNLKGSKETLCTYLLKNDSYKHFLVES